MAILCTSCGASLLEEELPRIQDIAKILCPECQQPLTLPEMTVPVELGSEHLPPGAARSSGPPSVDKKFALLILNGPDAGKVIAIEKAEVTIGRSGCDIVLDDPEISRVHAKILILGPEVMLQDMGSTNGTFLDRREGEQRIQRVRIENRTKIRMGTHELAFVITERQEAS